MGRDPFLRNVLTLGGLHMFSKAVSFVLNSLVLFRVPTAVFGLFHLRMELVLFASFLMRAGIQSATIRMRRDGDSENVAGHGWRAVSESVGKRSGTGDVCKPVLDSRLPSLLTTVSLLTVPSVALALSAAYFCFLFPPADASFTSGSVSVSGYRFACASYGLAAIIELLGEPFYSVLLMDDHVGKRAAVEAVAVIVRSLFVFVSVFALSGTNTAIDSDKTVTALSIAQILYSSTLAAGHVSCAGIQIRHTLRLIAARPLYEHLDHGLAQLSFALIKQSILSQLLCQVDAIAVAFMTGFEKQGEYALVANYGGLFVRLLFHPFEEALRLKYSKQNVLHNCGQSATREAERDQLCESHQMNELYKSHQMNELYKSHQMNELYKSHQMNELYKSHQSRPRQREESKAVNSASDDHTDMASVHNGNSVAVGRGQSLPKFHNKDAAHILLTLEILGQICAMALVVGCTAVPRMLAVLGLQSSLIVLAKCYVVYLACLCLNGAAESFVSSTITISEMESYNRTLVALTVWGAFQSTLMVLRFGNLGILLSSISTVCLRLLVNMFRIHAKCAQSSGAKLDRALVIKAAVSCLFYYCIDRITFEHGTRRALVLDTAKLLAFSASFCVMIWVFDKEKILRVIE